MTAAAADTPMSAADAAKTAYEQRKANANPRSSDPHISDQPITLGNWWKHLHFFNIYFLLVVPMMGMWAAYYTPLQRKTLIWSIIYYFNTGLGITAGYHRLWSHSAYSATLPLKIWLAALGAGSVQGSIRWWSRNHRAHHRYTDTDKDPYSVRKGFWYSHLGWLILHQDPKRVGRADISDLNEDPIVVWQHKHFGWSLVVMGVVVPCCVAGLGWGDWRGGFIYAGILRIFVVQQATFCVNSLAHWFGDQPFDDRNSPRNHAITALVTLGEGYHNFHHEFPNDYRNAIEWHQYDPTKWIIWIWKQLGLAYDLKQFRSNEIEKGRLQQQQKQIDRKRATLDWGISLEQLPVMEFEEYQDECKNGRALILIAGVVHDIADFMKDHPGGRAMINSGIGKDATAIFNGGVYEHSNAAHNLLSNFRVAVIRGGCEVEIWKQAAKENRDAVPALDSEGRKIIRAGAQVTRMAEPLVAAPAS